MRDDVRGLLDAGRNGTLHYGVDGQRRGEGLDVFVESFAPPPRMIVFGAIDFASAVARIGSFLGFRVTVCDARPVFATASRFPGAHEVVVEWPHRYLAAEAQAGRIDGRTVLCVLTHDPKFDVPLLEVALRLPEVAYIGAMGSRRTHDDRRARLLERGLTEAELARMSSADRAGPGRAHAGGDGGVDRGGDDRDALGRRGRPAGGPRGPHPLPLSPPERGSVRSASSGRFARFDGAATRSDRSSRPRDGRPHGRRRLPSAPVRGGRMRSPAPPCPAPRGGPPVRGPVRRGVAVVASTAPSGATTRPGRPRTTRYGRATWSSSTTPGASPPRRSAPGGRGSHCGAPGGRVGPAPWRSGGAAATRTGAAAPVEVPRPGDRVRARLRAGGRARGRPPGRAPAVRRHRPGLARGRLAERAADPPAVRRA